MSGSKSSPPIPAEVRRIAHKTVAEQAAQGNEERATDFAERLVDAAFDAAYPAILADLRERLLGDEAVSHAEGALNDIPVDEDGYWWAAEITRPVLQAALDSTLPDTEGEGE